MFSETAPWRHEADGTAHGVLGWRELFHILTTKDRKMIRTRRTTELKAKFIGINEIDERVYGAYSIAGESRKRGEFRERGAGVVVDGVSRGDRGGGASRGRVAFSWTMPPSLWHRGVRRKDVVK